MTATSITTIIARNELGGAVTGGAGGGVAAMAKAESPGVVAWK